MSSILAHRRKAFRGAPINPGTADLEHFWNLNNIAKSSSSDGLWDQTRGFDLTVRDTVGTVAASATGGPGGIGAVDLDAGGNVGYGADETSLIGWAGTSQDFSVSIWFQTDTLSTTGNWIMNWRGSGPGTGRLTQIFFREDGTADDLRCGIWDKISEGEDLDQINSGYDPGIGSTWHHAVQVWDSATTTHTLYCDKVVRGEQTNAAIGDLETATMPFALGNITWNPLAATANAHNGKLALCGIWDKALTAPEVAFLYGGATGAGDPADYSDL